MPIVPTLRSTSMHRRNTPVFHLFIIITLLLSVPGSAGDSDQMKTVSSCTTSIQDQEENAKRNIGRAASIINRYTIAPNASFSFNDVVGEANEINGYENGGVLYQGEVRYESGGGVCQVSSTLFNAMLNAGFVIIERHRHYRPVTYVPPGLDATIRYGKKDLKMRNPYPFELTIETKMTGRSLVIIIKSRTPLPYTFEVYTEEDVAENPLSDGNPEIRDGMNVAVFRKTLSGGNVLKSQLLYRDYYPPVRKK